MGSVPAAVAAAAANASLPDRPRPPPHISSVSHSSLAPVRPTASTNLQVCELDAWTDANSRGTPSRFNHSAGGRCVVFLPSVVTAAAADAIDLRFFPPAVAAAAAADQLACRRDGGAAIL